jgi:hypothetical protein
MIRKNHEILKPFIEKPWQKFTFSQVKEGSKKKSESYVYNSLKKFVKEKILAEEKAGNVTLYSLNLNSLQSQVYAGFTAEHMAWHNKHFPLEDLQRMALKIPTPFFIFLVTGSYAKNTQKKESDIDVAVICDDSIEPKKVYAELKHECEMNIPPIHLYVFRKSELLGMLLSDKQNYGKELAGNHALLYGGQEYFRIMAEATKNGFNG